MNAKAPGRSHRGDDARSETNARCAAAVFDDTLADWHEARAALLRGQELKGAAGEEEFDRLADVESAAAQHVVDTPAIRFLQIITKVALIEARMVDGGDPEAADVAAIRSDLLGYRDSKRGKL